MENVNKCLIELEYVKKVIIEELEKNLPPLDISWTLSGLEDACILPEDIPKELKEDVLDIMENIARSSELVRVRCHFTGTTTAVRCPQTMSYLSGKSEYRLKAALKVIDEIFENV